MSVFPIRAKHTASNKLGNIVTFLALGPGPDDPKVVAVFIADDGEFMMPSLGWFEVIDGRFVKEVGQ